MQAACHTAGSLPFWLRSGIWLLCPLGPCRVACVCVCVCICELANLSSVHLSSAFLLRQRASETTPPHSSLVVVEIGTFHGGARGGLSSPSLRGTENSPPSRLQVRGPAEGWPQWSVALGMVCWDGIGVSWASLLCVNAQGREDPEREDRRGKRGFLIPECGCVSSLLAFSLLQVTWCGTPSTHWCSAAECLCGGRTGVGVLQQAGAELDLSSRAQLIWLRHCRRM